eukprot:GHUV01032939.1.p1 GENE.GHUV01032939.1~~GHUV01032939.1.p1  ORF type:complete len:107 (-),score=20.97 GHUV01032939.1:354-674(-)
MHQTETHTAYLKGGTSQERRHELSSVDETLQLVLHVQTAGLNIGSCGRVRVTAGLTTFSPSQSGQSGLVYSRKLCWLQHAKDVRLLGLLCHTKATTAQGLSAGSGR